LEIREIVLSHRRLAPSGFPALACCRFAFKISVMNHLIRLGAALALAVSISSCGASRSAFRPQSGPPTVGMPAELSERERSFVPEVESALHSRGFVPVRHGAGDMELAFEIAEGPINTDTNIELTEQGRLVAEGRGRAAGAPLIGRKGVAEKSFQRAFSEFQTSLSGSSSGRRSAVEPADGQEPASYVY
jgi:hypothetical protein